MRTRTLAAVAAFATLVALIALYCSTGDARAPATTEALDAGAQHGAPALAPARAPARGRQVGRTLAPNDTAAAGAPEVILSSPDRKPGETDAQLEHRLATRQFFLDWFEAYRISPAQQAQVLRILQDAKETQADNAQAGFVNRIMHRMWPGDYPDESADGVFGAWTGTDLLQDDVMPAIRAIIGDDEALLAFEGHMQPFVAVLRSGAFEVAREDGR